jgi:hypothetical protein
MSYRNQGSLKTDHAPHVPSADEMGFLVLNDAGSILEVRYLLLNLALLFLTLSINTQSGGDLTRASDLAKTFHSMALSVMTLSLRDQSLTSTPKQPQAIPSSLPPNVKIPVLPVQLKVQYESFFFNILIMSQTRIVVTKHPLSFVST